MFKRRVGKSLFVTQEICRQCSNYVNDMLEQYVDLFISVNMHIRLLSCTVSTCYNPHESLCTFVVSIKISNTFGCDVDHSYIHLGQLKYFFTFLNMT